MTDTLQLEDTIQLRDLHDAPKLLVEWSPRWQEFVTSIRPAFARSGPRLAGEAPHGIFPYAGLLASLLLEAFIVFVLIVIPKEIAKLRPYAAPKVQPYEVIYYSGDELPRTEDLGGAPAGATGRAGGHDAHHRTQTIHVARGGSLAPKVVDAPNLKLPSAAGAVANLLAFKATNPGPPPSKGLHSSLVAPRIPVNVIAPPPANITRDQFRAALTLDSVVPPAPSISSDKSRSAPALNAAVVPPAPSVRSEHTLIAPALDPSIIAPAPRVSRERTLAAPSLTPSVIAPASTRVSGDKARPAPALSASVIPPAPATVGSEVAPTRVQMNNVAVVPPPVSAPERDSSRTAKLNLPAPSVVAPPPSADSVHDLRRLESGSTDPSKAVVPPPPTPTSNGSFVSTVIGKLFGTQDVVPPPPTVSAAGASGAARNGEPGGSLATKVVPPPPAISSATAGKTAGTRGESLAAKIVPPPPSIGVSGNSTPGRTGGANLGASNVIPPPPSVAGPDTSHGSPTGAGNSGRSGSGAVLAGNVVPPPPSIGSGSGLSGSGRKGSGLGAPGDSGSVLAPPKNESGSSDGSGVVISSQPGSKVGMPGGGKGSLAMSPSGGDKPGLGGSGGGASIGHGEGPGSGLNSTGSGAGKTGTGVGSDPNKNVRAGISPTPGPGGAGSAATGSPAVPGVDVRGGSTSVVNLPSFGSDSSSAPNSPDHTPAMPNQGPAITIVATSRSGGAFDFYGKLPGDNYTVYVDTSIGTVVMQVAEVNPAAHSEGETFTAPRGYVTDLPANLPHARVVIKCRLDTSGKLQNLQVIEPGPAPMTAKIMAALPNWKFRPAMRGTRPVEINAILGFNINTDDRY
ncbi:MAG: energy transducer TonB [Candidatus Sulfotelmatobacter sp.]